ncbi:flagellar biosynthetic protein FliR [Parvularcula marina]|jgi:flagellar biosynthesis protein FliR|uniref:flagellar biosynthetic protein FliR n=1 Tax=Parvularcula marina TaxID=2292771 RepID=UPI003511F882
MDWLAGLAIPPEMSTVATAGIALIARLAAMISFIPGIGELGVPMRVRLAIILALTAALFPLVVPGHLEAVSQMGLVPLMLFEVVIGFALGFSFRVLIYTLTIAGTIVAQNISLSQIFSPTLAAEPNTSVSMLLIMAGSALFVTMDWHTASVGLLYQSYELFPLGEVPASDALARWAIERTSGAFALAVGLALPFLLINFLYNLVLGLINQAMPQMMVTFIGVPGNVLAGLVILGLAIATMLTVWADSVMEAFGGFW